MRKYVLLALALALTGCFEEQKRQAAVCEAQALRTYPTESFKSSPAIEHYIHVCMQAAGYETRLTKRCAAHEAVLEITARLESDETPAGSPSEVVRSVDQAAYPYCYAPDGWLWLALYRLELRQDATLAK